MVYGILSHYLKIKKFMLDENWPSEMLQKITIFLEWENTCSFFPFLFHVNNLFFPLMDILITNLFIYNVVKNNVALKKHLCFLIFKKIWITFLIFSQDNFIQHKPHIYFKKKTYVHPKQHNSRFVTAKFVSQWTISKAMKTTRQYM